MISAVNYTVQKQSSYSSDEDQHQLNFSVTAKDKELLQELALKFLEITAKCTAPVITYTGDGILEVELKR